jgi:hypothetical protein
MLREHGLMMNRGSYANSLSRAIAYVLMQGVASNCCMFPACSRSFVRYAGLTQFAKDVALDYHARDQVGRGRSFRTWALGTPHS